MVHQKVSTRRPELYGVTGKKGHGKDTFAALVEKANGSFSRTHFAAALKHMAGRIFRLSDGQMHDPAMKEQPLPYPVAMDLFAEAMRRESGLPIQVRGKVARTPREVLQFFGTDYVRSVQEDFWIQKTCGDLRNKRQVLIPDARYPNEAAALRSLGGLIIKILRIDAPVSSDAHSSETEIDRIEPDLLIGVRTGDLSLAERVAGLVAMNRFADALRYDYRKASAAMNAYKAGASVEQAAWEHLGAKNTEPLHNILAYYGVPKRTKAKAVRQATTHEVHSGLLSKKCCYCLEWRPLAEFNASSKTWDQKTACCRSCASGYNQKRYRAPNGGNNTLAAIYKQYKRDAPRRGLSFDLSLEDLQALLAKQNGCCAYSGRALTTEIGSQDKLSIDRVDSSRPYIIGNVVLCTKRVNVMKGDMPVDQFIQLVGEIAANTAPGDDDG